MGLQDREYRRRRTHEPFTPKASRRARLETVPQIGPSRAALIVAKRPYHSVDDLLQTSGIGDQTLNTMRPFPKIDGDTEARP